MDGRYPSECRLEYLCPTSCGERSHSHSQVQRLATHSHTHCKKCPSTQCRYEFLYKQAVESTDVFLGMSGKDESSTSCEQMVVKVQLPQVESIAGVLGETNGCLPHTKADAT